MAKDRAKRRGGGAQTVAMPKNSEIAPPENIKAECEKALAAQRRGNAPKSLRLIVDLCHRHELNVDAIRTYVEICSNLESSFTKPKHLPEASKLAEQGVQKFPESPEYALVRAEALFVNGAPADSHREIERGLAMHSLSNKTRADFGDLQHKIAASMWFNKNGFRKIDPERLHRMEVDRTIKNIRETSEKEEKERKLLKMINKKKQNSQVPTRAPENEEKIEAIPAEDGDKMDASPVAEQKNKRKGKKKSPRETSTESVTEGVETVLPNGTSCNPSESPEECNEVSFVENGSYPHLSEPTAADVMEDRMRFKEIVEDNGQHAHQDGFFSISPDVPGTLVDDDCLINSAEILGTSTFVSATPEDGLKQAAEPDITPGATTLCQSMEQLVATSDQEKLERRKGTDKEKARKARPRSLRNKVRGARVLEESRPTVKTEQDEPIDQSPLSELGLLGKGLKNGPGRNNCFLNTAIQILWHLNSFRIAVLTLPKHDEACTCLACPLTCIFDQLLSPEDRVIDACELRARLKNFTLNIKHDAAEALEALLEGLHNATPNCEKEQPSRDCLAHGLFGLEISEYIRCSKCDKLSRMNHFSKVVIDMAEDNLWSTEAVKLAYDERATCVHCPTLLHRQPVTHPYTRSFSVRPIFILHVGWQQAATKEKIVAAFGSIKTRINLGALESSEVADHVLVSLGVFYGYHYQAFCLVDGEHWVKFSDEKIQYFGTWDNVVKACCNGRLQPCLLTYVSIDFKLT